MSGKKIINHLAIEDIASGGAGIGYYKNKIVFAQKAFPGDIVKTKIQKNKKNYIQALPVEIEKSSFLRKNPFCPHYPRCGGCKWQPLSYDTQLKYKEKLVEKAFIHIGKFKKEELPLLPIVPAIELFHYRNKMEFSFGPQRGKLTLGLHEPGSWNKIFDVKNCKLFTELSNSILSYVRRKADEIDIPAYDNYSHKGALRFLVMKRGVNTGELLVNLISSRQFLEKSEKLADAITAAYPEISTVIHSVTDSKAAVAVGEEEKIIKGKGSIKEHLLGNTFLISSNTFFQSNTKQAEILFQTAFQLAEIENEENILELYSGTGAISLLAAAKAKHVSAIEIVRESVNRAEENKIINRVENCSFIHGDVKNCISSFKDKNFSTVIVDPPRPGMDKKAIDILNEIHLNQLLYISCNPDTLARDAEILVHNGSFTLKAICPVDMFPQTPHIETICVFKKNV